MCAWTWGLPVSICARVNDLCGRAVKLTGPESLIAGIAVSKLAWCIDSCLLCLLCVVQVVSGLCDELITPSGEC